ncbi:MAG TPA: rod shape-determining protein RodA [Candidatus Angelobacter sp.]|nr:rod shape-determining protein RodA [Candidatus Angelobacter sp.]
MMLGPLELQPSELMKISLVLALARFLHGKSVEDISKPLNLGIALAMIGLPAFFVVVEPNLGTTLIILADGCSLLFLAGLSWYWIAPALAAVATAVPLAWRFVLHDYQKARVMTFLDPEADALGAGWNITQAKIAIGSGGLSGKGFLNGTQSRLNFLPEKQTDFIFTNFGEEFGFVGSVALLILFAVVIFYGLQISLSARSQFSRLLAMGITLNFFFYIMINGLMVMGLIPVVGIPMPLLSYGGTAMLTVMFGFGLLMSVHVHRQVEIPRHSGGII